MSHVPTENHNSGGEGVAGLSVHVYGDWLAPDLEAQQQYFMSRDTCSDSIIQLFCDCFLGYRTIITRYVANGVSHRCAYVRLSAEGGLSHHFHRSSSGGAPEGATTLLPFSSAPDP